MVVEQFLNKEFVEDDRTQAQIKLDEIANTILEGEIVLPKDFADVLNTQLRQIYKQHLEEVNNE